MAQESAARIPAESKIGVSHSSIRGRVSDESTRGLGQHDRGRHLLRVRERHLELEPASGGQVGRTPVEAKRRRLARAAFDLDLPRGQRHAERLYGRLLGGEPGRQMAAGTQPRTRVRQLRFREQTLRETRPTLERALEALDLDQVDPDPGHGTSAAAEPAAWPESELEGASRRPSTIRTDARAPSERPPMASDAR